MLNKVSIGMLRRGDIVRFEPSEEASTWYVKKVEGDKILLELNTIFYFESKTVKKSTRRKKYVFVEVE
jgi:hypothetical protein